MKFLSFLFGALVGETLTVLYFSSIDYDKYEDEENEDIDEK